MGMKFNLVTILVLLAATALAEIPAGYYDSAEGLSGEALQWALHSIIDNHDAVSYDYIWTAFFTTDDIYGNKVWDMYSDVPGGTPPYLYTLGDDQGGSASGEGAGYNREHSWPKSWFGDSSPMNTDLFHVVPSDIYVNNRRGNYPYAEVNNPTWTSLNGCRLGPSVTPGYSGTAFEPIDGYKGDFARNYFYMATRYKGEDGGWPGSAMADGADLEDWAVDMLLEWHENDPVSDKEIERNDAIYAIQENRNPFIDHPEYAVMIYDPASGISGGFIDNVIELTCYPNPFSSSVNISVDRLQSAVVSLSVHDITGRTVAEISTPEFLSGSSAVFTWNGSMENGETAGPGLFFVVLRTSETSVSSCIVFLDH